MFGAEWTGRRVEERLVEAFRKMPNRAIYSPRSGILQPALLDQLIDGAGLILATHVILGHDSPARVELLTYARARARRCVRATCREMGVSRATFYRHVRAAAERVAAELNHSAAARRLVS
jgi:hypothetical protein